jgi:hypothetical protein
MLASTKRGEGKGRKRMRTEGNGERTNILPSVSFFLNETPRLSKRSQQALISATEMQM